MSASVSTRSSSLWEDCEDSIVDLTYAASSPNGTNDSVDSNDEARKRSVTAVNNQNDIFFEDDTSGPITFTPSLKKVSTDIQLPTSTANAESAAPIMLSPAKKGEKRRKQPEKWKINIIKKNRNSGEQYVNLKKIIQDKRAIKPSCKDCRYECSKHFSEDNRKEIFSAYWALGDIEKQRQFIDNCMQIVERMGENRTSRQNNMAYFLMNNDVAIRVCKLFFKNTLDINDRPIRTVLAKREKLANQTLEPDQRGKHGKHKKLDQNIASGVREFIENIPKIESHYTWANTSKIFIEGSKTISSIYRDYVDMCKEKNQASSTYIYFYRVFTEDFNITFFVPQKDVCEQCVAYTNMTEEEKLRYKPMHENHLEEINFAQEDKRKDKVNENENAVVAVYDLQAVMQLPKGEVSAFYYKSKINVFNFTIYNIKTNNCQCFVWDEANGKCGVNELGTCVLEYIKSLTQNNQDEIIFYSDNCAGQQKNKFMIAMYLYAVRYLGIKSITHKYLITGHTQNEVDSAHSLIERATKRMRKSAPIYTTESYITIIRSAKKIGQPFLVKEMSYEDFFDLKILLNDMGPFNMGHIQLSEVAVLKVQRESPNSVFFKTSYAEEEFREANIIRSKKKQNKIIDLTKAYHAKIGIPNNKREDINKLIKKNLIPRIYQEFYNKL